MSYGDEFVLTLFTNDPDLAVRADRAGIDRIGVDIEKVGKNQRQGHLNTWISDHCESDIQHLRPILQHAQLFARCNPIHPNSEEEIDRLIEYGTGVLMLPYFKTIHEAEKFLRLIDDRATPVLLVETKEAASIITDICHIDPSLEIHIGLNDMRLSLGWPTHFHVLISDFLVQLCEPVLEAGLRLGIGGVGKVGDARLPVHSNMVIAQLPRLGATATLISRAFFSNATNINLSDEIGALRSLLDDYSKMPGNWLESERARLENKITPPSIR